MQKRNRKTKRKTGFLRWWKTTRKKRMRKEEGKGGGGRGAGGAGEG